MTQEIAQLLNKIFELAQYDQDTKSYYLSKKDYLYLNMSRNTRLKLNKLSKKLGINIEYPNKPLPDILCEELFEEYNQIQTKLNKKISSDERKQLETRKIELRNQIVVANLPLVKIIINHRIEDINTNMSKDDIYQIGYEMLIKYIDRNYLDKKTFKHHISCTLVIYIEKELLHLEKNENYYQQEQISIIKTKRKNDLSEKRIKELVNLENITTPLSLNDEDEDINDENNNHQLIYNFDEDSIFNRYCYQKYLNLILSTFPKNKQRLLNLYFGLNGNKEHTIVEIAKMEKLTKSAVSSYIIDVLNIIKKSYRLLYLKDIYEIPDSYIDELDPFLNRSFEEFLIMNLDERIIEYILKSLNQRQKEFLNLYYYNQEYSMTEIAKILNISNSYLNEIKKDTIEAIRKILIESISKDNQMTHQEYIEYLMNLYKKQSRVLKK